MATHTLPTLPKVHLNGNQPNSGVSSSASSIQPDSPVTEPANYELPGQVDSQDENDRFIMVAGGLGYIGSHTTLELLKAGYNVIVVDNLSNSFDKVLNTVKILAEQHCKSIGKKLPKVVFHELDYRSPAMKDVLRSYAVKQPHGGPESAKIESRIAGVIHFAAYKSVEESISKPLDYYQNNVCGLVDFLALLQEFEIRNFVFSSSATVYGEKTNAGKPLREEDLVHHDMPDPKNPKSKLIPGTIGITSPYGRTKYFSEAILADMAFADPKWKITALRYFNPVGCHESGILGEDPRQKPTNLFPVIGRVLTGDSDALNMFGNDWDTRDGTAIRDFIHIVDLARGHVAAMDANSKGVIKEPFRAYNLGTGNGASVQEVVDAVEKAVGRKIPVNHAPRRAGDVGYCVAVTDRVNTELKWKATKSTEDAAKDMWNFLSQEKLRNKS